MLADLSGGAIAVALVDGQLLAQVIVLQEEVAAVSEALRSWAIKATIKLNIRPR